MAHQRFAFKGALRKPSPAGSALRYAVISFAALDAYAFTHLLTAAFIPAWVLVMAIKFLLLRNFVWGPGRLATPGGGPHRSERIGR